MTTNHPRRLYHFHCPPRSSNTLRPYFLVVSLINPHDVLMFPGSPTGGAAGAFPASGYPIENLTGSIGLPSTVTEPLDTKPNIQKVWVEAWMALAPLPNATFLLKYINFYGNLMKASDSYLVMILNALDAAGRTNDTVSCPPELSGVSVDCPYMLPTHCPPHP